MVVDRPLKQHRIRLASGTQNLMVVVLHIVVVAHINPHQTLHYMRSGLRQRVMDHLHYRHLRDPIIQQTIR